MRPRIALDWCNVNIVFTAELHRIDQPAHPATLTWREWVTVRRLRLGWTKADLAKAVGCSRTTLWRTVECAPDHERWQPLPPELQARIDAALDAAEAEATAA